MWVYNSTVNCKMRVPGMTATVAGVIIDCTNKRVSQIETESQIAARIEEELKNAG